MIVTIDGPAGSGKSTAAHALAERLGFDFLDTGAMYRAVALTFLRNRIDFKDLHAIEDLLTNLHVEMPRGQLLVNGEDVFASIRSPEVSQAASKVAVIPAVRWFLAEEQRAAAVGRDMVCEGRDQGTFVFPHADCKFFLTADPRIRAERRWREQVAKGLTLSVDDVLKAQEERDARDASRDLAPMKPAADAAVIDTTYLSNDEVLAKLEEVTRACRDRI
jgi:cytidylate kinase